MKKTLLKAVSLILAVSMLCSCTAQENNGSSDVSNTPEASTTTTDSKAPDKSEPESDTSADDTASSKVESTTQSEYDYVSSGHLPLDAVLFPLLDEITDEKMTDEEKLDALYAYFLELYYAERVLLIPQSKQHIAEQLYALSLFEKGYGICYDYSAAYTFAAKALGFEAKMVYGLHRNVDVDFSEHTWVEIVIDGETYIFDPSVEILLRQDGYSYGRKRFMKTYEEIGYYYSF